MKKIGFLTKIDRANRFTSMLFFRRSEGLENFISPEFEKI